jgi:hypothetical protein
MNVASRRHLPLVERRPHAIFAVQFPRPAPLEYSVARCLKIFDA